MTVKELIKSLTSLPLEDWELPVKSGLSLNGVDYIDCVRARMIVIQKQPDDQREWIVVI